MRKSFTAKFNFGDEVQLKTEPGKRIISGYILRPRQVSYFTAQGDTETCHQGIEIESFVSKKPGFKG